MSKFNLFRNFIILMFLLAIPAAGVVAQDDGHTEFVRVPTTSLDRETFSDLGLSPIVDLDYGSFAWLELSERDFAALSSSSVDFTHVPNGGVVQIGAFSFDPIRDGPPELASRLQSSGEGQRFHLVQFVGPVKDTWLEQLEAAGLPMLQYYPNNAYLTWGTFSQLENAEALDFVRWQGPIEPGYKLNNDLFKFSGRINNVDVMFFNNGDIDSTINALNALGANVLNLYPSQPDKAFFDVILEIDSVALQSVAQINTVLWLGYSSPEPGLEDEMASQIVAGNHPGGVPVTGYNAHLANLGVDGTGVIWSVIDTGVDYAHNDLNSHIVGGFTYPGAPAGAGPGDDCAGGGHGTHVAGIIGGDATYGDVDANGFLYGLGIAPAYGIFAQNSLCAPSWPPVGGWQEHSKQAVLGSAIGGNNSWTTGEGTQHGYQTSERTHDLIVRDGNFDTTNVTEPFIEVFSAGNSAFSGLTAPKEAKNLIVVASSQNFRTGSIDQISGFSSRGPAVDGRWVPTVAAPGEDIASAHRLAGVSQCTSIIPGTNNHYAWCSGTSMAAPQVSGVIVLTTEWWRTFNSGADPSPAMAKALLVNNAVDMGTADIPNIHEGWGRVNVTNIISPSVPVLYEDQTIIFNNTGEQFSMSLGIADPAKPLKITLAWSDAPGAVGANPALVNNLDLTVINGANTYLGNVFTGGWSATGGAADTINNLENVFIQNPAGEVTITIDATNIAGDGVPYNGDVTDQDFVLVCQNCVFNQDFTLTATPPTQSICTPDDAIFDVSVGSILGYSDSVTLSASGHPNPPNSALFSDNNLAAPYTSTLTIGTTGASGGSYSIDIVGIAPTSTHTSTVGLELYNAIPAAGPVLSAPPNGATDVTTQPTFDWNAVADAGVYYLEVATDPGFTNVVYDATVDGLSHTTTSALNPATQYFWRVTAENTCGAGTPSATWTFVTANLICNASPFAIPDNTPGGVTDSLVIGSGGTLQDLNISLDVTHTYVGDLFISLEHDDTGTTVTLFDRPGVPASTFGCSDNDIMSGLADDEGTDILDIENHCGGSPWINSQSFVPTNALSSFDGENLSGTWTLLVSDNAGADTGTVEQWCLLPATDGGGPTDPVISIVPSELASMQDPDTVITDTLTIWNLGGSDLNWTVTETSSSCAAPADVAWLGISPTAGTTISNTNTLLEATVDSTGLSAGVYTSTLCVDSNDLVTPLVEVPVTMTVNAEPVFYIYMPLMRNE